MIAQSAASLPNCVVTSCGAACRDDQICCFTSNMQDRVFPTTPIDVFVFSISNAAEAFVNDNCPQSLLTNVYFLPLNEHWVLPDIAGPESTWSLEADFSPDYRRMGCALGFSVFDPVHTMPLHRESLSHRSAS